MTGLSGVCRLAPVRFDHADWDAAVELDVQPHRPAPPIPGLTVRQEQILNFITAYIDTYGYPPSLREIGAAVGLKSPSNVSYQVGRLAELGVLDRSGVARRARGLRLVRGGAAGVA